MATLAQGIVGGDMPWALVGVGILFGIAMIMMQVKSPMLVAVGMYLPFGTTFAIFVGGVFRSVGDWVAERRGYNAAQKARVENAGVLTASGLIAGEALTGVGLGRIAICSPMEGAEPSAATFQQSVLSCRRPDRTGWTRCPADPASDYRPRAIPSEPAPPTAMM